MALRPAGVQKAKTNLTEYIDRLEANLDEIDVRYMPGMHTVHVHGTPEQPQVHIVTYVPNVLPEEIERLAKYEDDNQDGSMSIKYDTTRNPHRIVFDLLNYLKGTDHLPEIDANSYSKEHRRLEALVNELATGDFRKYQRLKALAIDLLRLPEELRQTSALARIISPNYQPKDLDSTVRFSRVHVGPWPKTTRK